MARLASCGQDGSRCRCPKGTFVGGENQQCKDFYGSPKFPKRRGVLSFRGSFKAEAWALHVHGECTKPCIF